jgi:hypothetical protein
MHAPRTAFIIGSIFAASIGANPFTSSYNCLTFSFPWHILPSHNAVSDRQLMSLQSTIHRYESPFFTSNDGNHHSPSSALIILNTPIINLSQDRDGHTANEGNDDGDLSGVLGVLWKASSYRVCADGGANRLYDATVAIMTRKEDRGVGINDAVSNNCNPDFLPDLITGDLDSLRSDVRMYYETKGVPVIRVQDQNYHDLDVRMYSLMIQFLLH